MKLADARVAQKDSKEEKRLLFKIAVRAPLNNTSKERPQDKRRS